MPRPGTSSTIPRKPEPALVSHKMSLKDGIGCWELISAWTIHKRQVWSRSARFCLKAPLNGRKTFAGRVRRPNSPDPPRGFFNDSAGARINVAISKRNRAAHSARNFVSGKRDDAIWRDPAGNCRIASDRDVWHEDLVSRPLLGREIRAASLGSAFLQDFRLV